MKENKFTLNQIHLRLLVHLVKKKKKNTQENSSKLALMLILLFILNLEMPDLEKLMEKKLILLNYQLA
jgi:hypothetical protein